MRIAQANETEDMYQKNLGMLTQWLRESVQSIDERELWSRVKVRYNAEGYPICSYRGNGQRSHITGEKPVVEARRWWESIPDTMGAGAIFLYGSGFGYPVFEIFSRKKAHTLVVVFEEDICLFKAMLYYFDFQPVIESAKVVFLIGDPSYYAQAFEQLFFNVFFISCTAPVTAFTYAAQRNFKERYLKIHADVFSKLALLVGIMGNDHKDNLIGFRNIMANVPAVLENPDISCLKDQYRGYPAFIVSNGPSLDKSMGRLRDIRGRGLMICVESASIPLIKNGVKPDVLAVIERIRESYTFHFKDVEYANDTALLALALADPHIFSSFRGEAIPVFRDREIVNLWVSQHLGDGSVIDAGANVSHMAAELALYMGADPVIFVGQDLAYGPDFLTHSKDSVYAEEKGQKARERIQSRPVVFTEGNDGGQVPSNELWLDFKKGLEMKIAAHPERTFINATQSGAKIAGTVRAKLEDAIGQYCVCPLARRVSDRIADARKEISASQKKKGLEELIESVRQYIRLFRDTALEANRARLFCQDLLRILPSEGDAQQSRMLEEAYQKNVAIFNRLIMNGMLRCFLQQVIFANYYRINSLKLIDTPEKIVDVFRIHGNFFMQIAAVCQSVTVNLEEAQESLERELECICLRESGERNE